MKYVFTFKSSALLTEHECKLLQQEFHDMIIKHFEDGMSHKGVIRNMRKEK